MKTILYIVCGLVLIGCLNLCIAGCKDSNNRSLTEMLEENDFAAANKYLTEIYDQRFTPAPHHDIETRYLPKAIKTLKAEATYLMDQDDPDAETLFMLCLNDVSGNIGNYQPVLGFFDGEKQYNTEYIIKEVTPYNACLISIIKEAVIKNKPEFAKKVFKMMKQNYNHVEKLKPGEDSGYTHEYTEDNSQIAEAQAILSQLE